MLVHERVAEDRGKLGPPLDEFVQHCSTGATSISGVTPEFPALARRAITTPASRLSTAELDASSCGSRGLLVTIRASKTPDQEHRHGVRRRRRRCPDPTRARGSPPPHRRPAPAGWRPLACCSASTPTRASAPTTNPPPSAPATGREPVSISVLLCTHLSGICGGSAGEFGHLAVCIPMR